MLSGDPAGEWPRVAPLPAGAEDEFVKRTYSLRADQDRAMQLAIAQGKAGFERPHVSGQAALEDSRTAPGHSTLIRALLDLHGYNADYLRGDPLR